MVVREQGLLVEERNGLSMYDVRGEYHPPFAEIAALAEVAWRADYGDEVHMVYDEQYWSWILGDAFWTGLAIRDKSSGALVGFTYALTRSLSIAGRPVASVLSSGMMIAPTHRRRGIAAWIYETGGRLLFGSGSEPIVEIAALQVGHAGVSAAAIGAAARDSSSTDTLYLPICDIWRKRLSDRAPAAAWGTGWQIDPVRRGGSRQADLRWQSARQIIEQSVAEIDLAYCPTQQFERLYLGNLSRSGTFLARHEEVPRAAVTYSSVPLAINGMPIGNIGQLQSIYAGECSEQDLAAIVYGCTEWLLQAGCVAVTVVDHGSVPEPALKSAGFTRSEERLLYKLQGHPSLIADCRNLQPPFAIDFH